jgi:hypothetical protein
MIKTWIEAHHIEAWAGSDATRETFLELLVELITGKYTAEQFADDVWEYKMDCDYAEEMEWDNEVYSQGDDE